MNISECMELIKSRLNKRKPIIIPNRKSYKEAAVLIPIFGKDGKIYVLFTKRSNHVEHHKGQISFPGGGVEETDPSVEYTALREACEEIGLMEEDVRILGRLDDTITFASGYIVHPIVGVIPYPYDFKINKREVENILFIPLDLFLKKGAGKFRAIFQDGKVYNSFSYEYDGHIIWGATARIIQNLVEAISGRSSAW